MLVPAERWVYDPTWAPDGSQLAFTHLAGISVVNADGSGIRRAAAERRLREPFRAEIKRLRYVVAEGWKELQVQDLEIDGMFGDPPLDLLRRYRNGVFHFQRAYSDKRLVKFLAEARPRLDGLVSTRRIQPVVR